jgi:hypothetical protein
VRLKSTDVSEEHRLLNCLFASYLIPASCLTFFGSEDATPLSETSLDSQETTRRYIPEDRTVRGQICEYFLSFLFFITYITQQKMDIEDFKLRI